MAYLKALPRCDTCRAPATEALCNRVNAVNGFYCSKHAKTALKDFQKRYEREQS